MKKGLNEILVFLFLGILVGVIISVALFAYTEREQGEVLFSAQGNDCLEENIDKIVRHCLNDEYPEVNRMSFSQYCSLVIECHITFCEEGFWDRIYFDEKNSFDCQSLDVILPDRWPDRR